ncbi:unnamed protein product [Rhizoctonia solani]|uniref:Uncharacterized protein n=1 Tax=Rhizoctonia solani TaxID=456999 RepID=A0A8H3CYK2_9AGAM|nr:unnamed protein product [Rhizoctonia solani]
MLDNEIDACLPTCSDEKVGEAKLRWELGRETLGRKLASALARNGLSPAPPVSIAPPVLTRTVHQFPGIEIASIRRNAHFHELFPNVPGGDSLIEGGSNYFFLYSMEANEGVDYGCTLARETLIQGRIYLSENHMSFSANTHRSNANLIIPFHSVIGLEKGAAARLPNAIQICTRTTKYTFASFLSRNITYDIMHSIWRLSHPESKLESDVAEIGGGEILASMHEPTQCVCGKEGRHFKTPVMDIIIPSTPEEIYNLMYMSGFLRGFMAGEQKLTEIQISDWRSEQPDLQLLTRNMTYTKPLNDSIGPEQTKCELKDEILHIDFDDYVSTLTTMHTPDVISGDAFAVKTRTCIMWAGATTSRLVVTTAVIWARDSYLQPMIDKSVINDQKQHYANLEKAIRSYIAAHCIEFVPEDAAKDSEALARPELIFSEAAGSLNSHTFSVGPSNYAVQSAEFSLGNLSLTKSTKQDHEASASQSLEETSTIAMSLDKTSYNDHPLVSTEASHAKRNAPSINEAVLKSIVSKSPSPSPVTTKDPSKVTDILQLHSPQYTASVMHEYLIQQGCADLSPSVDPHGFSSSAVAEGGFGDIWTGRFHNDGTKLAIKVLRFTSSTSETAKKELKRITREIYNWSKLDHQNVNKLMGVIMFRERLGMVSKWMEHGNLRQYLGRNGDVDRRKLCIQIARGVSYLHGINMVGWYRIVTDKPIGLTLRLIHQVHGDLKACNILVSSAGILKITDFDYSIISECSLAFSTTTRMGGGTLRWMAPELVVDEEPPQRNRKTDIYALGMTFLETITNAHPYSECRDTQIYRKLARQEHPKRSEEYFPDTEWGTRMWNLLLQCWDFDPASRPVADVIFELLLSLEKETRHTS